MSRLALALVAVSFVFYISVWFDGPFRGGDSASYLAVADDLRDFDLSKPHLRSIGYPLILLLTGNVTQPGLSLVIFQLLLYFTGVLVLANLLGRTDARQTTVNTFVAIACLPHLAHPAAWVLSESVAGSFLALGIALLGISFYATRHRLILLVTAGVFLAACAAVRPVYQSIPPALAITTAILLFRQSRTSARYYLSPIVLILPMLAVVTLTHGSARFRSSLADSPLLEFALSAKMANYVESLPDSKSEVREILIRHRNRSLLESRHHRAEGFIFRAWPELLAHFDNDQRAAKTALRRAVLTLIRVEPHAFLRLTWESLSRYFEWRSSDLPPARHRAVIAFLMGVHYTTVALLIAGILSYCLTLTLWPSLGRATKLSVEHRLRITATVQCVFLSVGVAILVPMLAQITLGVGVPRYRIPTDTLILFLVALFCDRFFRLRQFLASIST